jgi:hypothetical protein
MLSKPWFVSLSTSLVYCCCSRWCIVCERSGSCSNVFTHVPPTHTLTLMIGSKSSQFTLSILNDNIHIVIHVFVLTLDLLVPKSHILAKPPTVTITLTLLLPQEATHCGKFEISPLFYNCPLFFIFVLHKMPDSSVSVVVITFLPDGNALL